MWIWIWNSQKAGLGLIDNNPTAISIGENEKNTISLPLLSCLPDPRWEQKIQEFYLEIEKQKSIDNQEYYDAVIASKKLLTVEI